MALRCQMRTDIFGGRFDGLSHVWVHQRGIDPASSDEHLPRRKRPSSATAGATWRGQAPALCTRGKEKRRVVISVEISATRMSDGRFLVL